MRPAIPPIAVAPGPARSALPTGPPKPISHPPTVWEGSFKESKLQDLPFIGSLLSAPGQDVQSVARAMQFSRDLQVLGRSKYSETRQWLQSIKKRSAEDRFVGLLELQADTEVAQRFSQYYLEKQRCARIDLSKHPGWLLVVTPLDTRKSTDAITPELIRDVFGVCPIPPAVIGLVEYSEKRALQPPKPAAVTAAVPQPWQASPTVPGAPPFNFPPSSPSTLTNLPPNTVHAHAPPALPPPLLYSQAYSSADPSAQPPPPLPYPPPYPHPHAQLPPQSSPIPPSHHPPHPNLAAPVAAPIPARPSSSAAPSTPLSRAPGPILPVPAPARRDREPAAAAAAPAPASAGSINGPGTGPGPRQSHSQRQHHHGPDGNGSTVPAAPYQGSARVSTPTSRSTISSTSNNNSRGTRGRSRSRSPVRSTSSGRDGQSHGSAAAPSRKGEGSRSRSRSRSRERALYRPGDAVFAQWEEDLDVWKEAVVELEVKGVYQVFFPREGTRGLRYDEHLRPR